MQTLFLIILWELYCYYYYKKELLLTKEWRIKMKTLLKISIILALFVLSSTRSINAQSYNNQLLPGQEANELHTNFGIYGTGNFNFFTPNFAPDNTNSSLLFNSNKTTFNGSIGLIGNFPLNNRFVISGRVGYNGMSGTLNQTAGNTSYSLSNSLNYIDLSPVLQVHNLLFNENFYLLGGLEFGIPLTKTSTLTNQTATSTIANNSVIQNTQMRSAIGVGAGYNIPVSHNVNIIPEISYWIPMNNVSSSSNFSTLNIPQLRAGLSLTFGLGSGEPEKMVSKPVDNKFDVSISPVREGTWVAFLAFS